MKKTMAQALSVFFLVSVFAAGTQRTSSQTATKAQAQSTASDSVVRESTQNRLCEGLKLVGTKLGQLQASVSTVANIHNDFKVVTVKIRTEKLTPLFEKRTIAQETAQIKPGLVPAEKRQVQLQAVNQIQGFKGNLTRIRGTLQAQLADLEKSWRAVEEDMKRLTGLRPVSAVTPSRQCVVQEAKKVDSELATLGSQASNLQSQIDDLRAQLDQEYGQGPCGDPATCVSVDCISCCAWQYKITAPEGSAERSAQEAARAQCLLQCQRIEMTCMFKNFNQGADQLFNILSTVLKNTKEMQSSIIRNMI